MPGASVVLAFLLGTSPGASPFAYAAAPSSESGQASEPTPPAEGSNGGGTAGETAAPGGASEGDGGWDEAPAGEPTQPALVDPWALVPLQTVVVRPAIVRPAIVRPVVQPVAPRSTVSAPLLDPWAGGVARRHVPRLLDPELRDPFRGMQPRSEVPRIARADLRDPFARQADVAHRADVGRAGPATAPMPAVRSEPAEPEPGMPMHPDLRDPFGRRKARPTPPPSGAAPGPAPRPPAPSSPPRVLPREPSGELRPGALVPGALLPSTPFAHLPRTRRPA